MAFIQVKDQDSEGIVSIQGDSFTIAGEWLIILDASGKATHAELLPANAHLIDVGERV